MPVSDAPVAAGVKMNEAAEPEVARAAVLAIEPATLPHRPGLRREGQPPSRPPHGATPAGTDARDRSSGLAGP